MRTLLTILILLSITTQSWGQDSFPELRSLKPHSETYPSPSPDEAYVVYSAGAGFARNLFRLHVATGAITQLTNNESEDSAAAFSPDGSMIVFQREDTLGNRDIWVMNASGGDERNLTQTPDIREQHPRFSVDGAHVVYDANREETEEDGGADGVQNYEIYRHSMATGAIQRLTNWPHWDMYPAIGADGNRFVWRRAFTHPDTGERNFEIMVGDPSSGAEMNISNHEAVDTNPHLSPSGDLVVFASNRTGAFELYIIGADGSQLRRITNGGSPSIAYSRPTFSADGQTVYANRSVRGVTDMVAIPVPE